MQRNDFAAAVVDEMENGRMNTHYFILVILSIPLAWISYWFWIYEMEGLSDGICNIWNCYRLCNIYSVERICECV